MKTARVAVLALVALWIATLVVAGLVLGDSTGERVATRVGESLGGSGSVGGADVSLLRGRLEVQQLRVVRDDRAGHLALSVDDVRCDLPPLGLALVDRECRTLAVRGVRLDISAASLFHVPHPKRPPLHVDRISIDDAQLAFAPSAFAPELGRIAIHVDHAEAGETVLRTPLSWIFALRVLRARIDLPAGIALQLVYDRGYLSVSGTLFGSATVTLPVTMPLASAYADGKDETRGLLKLAEDLAEKLVARRAEDWLRKKLL